MPDKKEELSCEELLNRIREEILPLFEKAITDSAVFFENPNLVKCRAQKNCDKADCPVPADKIERCWQIAGTYCGGKVQGVFAEKYENCKLCDVYKAACPTIVEEIGEGLNNMLFLLRHKEHQIFEKSQKIGYLNRDLLSALENLDGKNREIQELMITDKLTGLYNRYYFATVLEDEIARFERRGYSFSIFLIDIDDFKKVNDTYGHLTGDIVLSELGALLKATLRKYDRAFRYGGEEFAVVLPETDPTMAWVVSERIRKGFAEKTFAVKPEEQLRKETFSCTVSIGYTTYRPETTIDQLLKQADDALYAAKTRGKNIVVKYDDI